MSAETEVPTAFTLLVCGHWRTVSDTTGSTYDFCGLCNKWKNIQHRAIDEASS